MGGMLLEVILMLSIMIAIFPFMQKQAKKRSDDLRNKQVIRELTKIKVALEKYLKSSNVSVNANLDTLKAFGLPADFQSTNSFGQEYKIKIKSSQSGNETLYNAIIYTKSGDISPIRVKEIVADSKGIAGYVEGDLVYSSSWQLNASSFGSGLFDNNSFVVRVGGGNKEDLFIHRISSTLGTNIMRTDLYFTSVGAGAQNNIYNVANLGVKETITGATLTAQTSVPTSNVNYLNVSDNLELSSSVSSTVGTLTFAKGFLGNNVGISDNNSGNIYLGGNLNITGTGSLSLNSSVVSNVLRSLKVYNLYLESNSILRFSGKLISKLYPKVLFGTLYTDKFDYIMTPTSDGDSNAGVKFTNIHLNSETSITGNTFNFNDVILKKFNTMFNQKEIGGIVINERTPLSLVLRALTYEYYDVWHVYHGFDVSSTVCDYTSTVLSNDNSHKLRCLVGKWRDDDVSKNIRYRCLLADTSSCNSSWKF